MDTTSLLSRLRFVAQCIVFGFLTLWAVIALSDLRKAGAPGAPVGLLYITIAAMTLIALAHFPKLFGRMPRKVQRLSYGAIVPAFVLLGTYLQAMEPAWERTAQGKQEVAKRVEREKRDARETAEQAARDKVDRERAKAGEALEKEADMTANRLELCKSLERNVISLSEERPGLKIIEINDISVDPLTDPDVLECSGMAVTSSGDRNIGFGLRDTPQGKTLVTLHFR